MGSMCHIRAPEQKPQCSVLLSLRLPIRSLKASDPECSPELSRHIRLPTASAAAWLCGRPIRTTSLPTLRRQISQGLAIWRQAQGMGSHRRPIGGLRSTGQPQPSLSTQSRSVGPATVTKEFTGGDTGLQEPWIILGRVAPGGRDRFTGPGGRPSKQKGACMHTGTCCL